MNGFCERLLCELACLASYLSRRDRTDAEIRGLLRNPVSVNGLLLWRVHEVEPENDFFSVRQNDMKAVPVIPALRLVNTVVEPLERLPGQFARMGAPATPKT